MPLRASNEHWRDFSKAANNSSQHAAPENNPAEMSIHRVYDKLYE